MFVHVEQIIRTNGTQICIPETNTLQTYRTNYDPWKNNYIINSSIGSKGRLTTKPYKIKDQNKKRDIKHQCKRRK